jgi:hypothetical protein
MPSKLNFASPRMALIVWNDAFQDAAFDGPLEEVPAGDSLQQTTIGFIISDTKRHLKFCNEFCTETKHVRNIVCIPRKYLVSVSSLVLECDTINPKGTHAAPEPQSKET